MNNSVDNDEKKIPKTVVNANIFNGVILFIAVFSQLSMIKIIKETQTEFAVLTYVVFALIVVLSGVNFKFQNLKWLNPINTVTAILLAINLYVFLFLIIGFWFLAKGFSNLTLQFCLKKAPIVVIEAVCNSFFEVIMLVLLLVFWFLRERLLLHRFELFLWVR